MRPRCRPRTVLALAALVALAACGTSSDVHTTRADPIGSAPVTTDGTTATTGPDTTTPASTGASDTTGTSQGSLQWDACTDPNAADPKLQCATLNVPLDYDNPTAAHIDLALIRAP